MITKSAFDQNAFTKNLIFTNSARNAWKLILNSVKKQQGFTNILLPSYIGFTEREGSGIFDPVEITISNYDFYNLKNDLSINYDHLVSLAASKKFNVLLIVHYFGFCRNDLQTIKSICQKYEIILVEDCAHAFHLGAIKENLGITGDFSFYSVHKYLAVYTGGILKDISGKVPLLPLPEEDKMSYDVAVQILKSDTIAIAEKRRENFKLYNKELDGLKGIEIMYVLKDEEIPQTFPILVKNKLRAHLYFFLMDKNMPTIALYYRLINNLNIDKYPIPYRISEEILNLPVHQDITEEDIKNLTGEIKYYFSRNK